MNMPATAMLGRVSGQEDLDIDFVRWTLFGPEEKLLAQGKAMIHTSCRIESSNKSLVVLDKEWSSSGVTRRIQNKLDHH